MEVTSPSALVTTPSTSTPGQRLKENVNNSIVKKSQQSPSTSKEQKVRFQLPPPPQHNRVALLNQTNVNLYWSPPPISSDEKSPSGWSSRRRRASRDQLRRSLDGTPFNPIPTNRFDSFQFKPAALCTTLDEELLEVRKRLQFYQTGKKVSDHIRNGLHALRLVKSVGDCTGKKCSPIVAADEQNNAQPDDDTGKVTLAVTSNTENTDNNDEEFECDDDILFRRLKQIDEFKSGRLYKKYLSELPKSKRPRDAPSSPSIYRRNMTEEFEMETAEWIKSVRRWMSKPTGERKIYDLSTVDAAADLADVTAEINGVDERCAFYASSQTLASVIRDDRQRYCDAAIAHSMTQKLDFDDEGKVAFKFEKDHGTILRRMKAMDMFYASDNYVRYREELGKNDRAKCDPMSPPVYATYSRRAWDGLVRDWKLKVHEWVRKHFEDSASTEASLSSVADDDSRRWIDADIGFVMSSTVRLDLSGNNSNSCEKDNSLADIPAEIVSSVGTLKMTFEELLKAVEAQKTSSN